MQYSAFSTTSYVVVFTASSQAIGLLIAFLLGVSLHYEMLLGDQFCLRVSFR